MPPYVAEVILLIVHQVDYLLTEAYRVEEHFISMRHSTTGMTTFDSVVTRPASNSNSVWLFVPGT